MNAIAKIQLPEATMTTISRVFKDIMLISPKNDGEIRQPIKRAGSYPIYPETTMRMKLRGLDSQHLYIPISLKRKREYNLNIEIRHDGFLLSLNNKSWGFIHLEISKIPKLKSLRWLVTCYPDGIPKLPNLSTLVIYKYLGCTLQLGKIYRKSKLKHLAIVNSPYLMRIHFLDKYDDLESLLIDNLPSLSLVSSDTYFPSPKVLRLLNAPSLDTYGENALPKQLSSKNMRQLYVRNTAFRVISIYSDIIENVDIQLCNELIAAEVFSPNNAMKSFRILNSDKMETIELFGAEPLKMDTEVNGHVKVIWGHQ